MTLRRVRPGIPTLPHREHSRRKRTAYVAAGILAASAGAAGSGAAGPSEIVCSFNTADFNATSPGSVLFANGPQTVQARVIATRPLPGAKPFAVKNFVSDTGNTFGGLAAGPGAQLFVVAKKNEISVLDTTSCDVIATGVVKPENGNILGAAFHRATNRLFTVNAGIAGGGPSVTSYQAPFASGDLVPATRISGPATGFVQPRGIDVSDGAVFVADAGGNAVRVFAPNATGNVPAVRTIQGPNTRLASPTAVRVEELSGTTDVFVRFLVADNEGAGSIKRFDAGTDGNVAPRNVIVSPSGSPNQIVFPQSLVVDLVRNQLLVSDARPSIRAYPLDTAGGDVTPLFKSVPEIFPRDLAMFPAPPATDTVFSVLPSARVVNTTASIFMGIINTGAVKAEKVAILQSGEQAPVTVTYQTTDKTTNALVGTPNTPVDIPAGETQTFALFFDAATPFPATQLTFDIAGVNTRPVAVLPGVNTVQLFKGAVPTVDPVMLAASATPGILDIPGPTGSAAFAVAMVNVSSVTDTVTISADTGGVTLPLSLNVCQTNPTLGQCISAIGPSVNVLLNPGDTPTVGIFAQAHGDILFRPDTNRVFVNAVDSSGQKVGQTSEAVRTSP